jgi:hypothetical protein
VAVAPSATFFDPELDNPMVPHDNNAVPPKKCACGPLRAPAAKWLGRRAARRIGRMHLSPAWL